MQIHKYKVAQRNQRGGALVIVVVPFSHRYYKYTKRKYTKIQIHKYANIQIHKYTNTRWHRGVKEDPRRRLGHSGGAILTQRRHSLTSKLSHSHVFFLKDTLHSPWRALIVKLVLHNIPIFLILKPPKRCI